MCSGEAQAAGEVVMQHAAARRASPAAAVTAKSLSSAPSLLSLLCVLSASAAAGHLADITIERRCSSQRRDCSRASSPVVYPRSRSSRTCCRPSGADSLRRRDCPRDAVVAGAVRHPALERQQRSRTWAGHLEEKLPTATTRWRSGHYRAKKLCETRPNCQLPQ